VSGKARLILLCVAAAAAATAMAAEKAEHAIVVPACTRPASVAVDVPAEVKLDGDGAWELLDDGEATPAELIDGPRRTLLAVIPPAKAAGGKARRLRLRRDGPRPAKAFAFKEVCETSLALHEGERPVFVYNHGTIRHPGKAEKFRKYDRSNYFHPLFGLAGEELTADFNKKDHPHHRGVFWAWPYLYVGEDRKTNYESWVPSRFEYRFERWTCRHAGAAAAALGVRTGWHAGDRKVVGEELLVTVYRSSESGRTIDVDLTWTAVDKPVTIKGRPGSAYGGFTFRFQKPEGVAITSREGVTKKDLVNARRAWMDLSGTFAGASVASGAAVLIHPEHPGHPPGWLTRHYGPLCVCWPGPKGATLQPGKPVRCRYRLWVHRGRPEAAAIQKVYEAYEAAAAARWAK